MVELADGSEIPCRAVIVATGARYQRLAVDDLERFEGAGVYYAATDLEARLCEGSDVVVVGGGNSAGQAAIYLAQQGSRVSIAIRRPDLTATMSRYLIDRIDADHRIELLTSTEVRALAGDTHLRAVTLEHTPTGERRELVVPGAVLLHRGRTGHGLARRHRRPRRPRLRPDRPLARPGRPSLDPPVRGRAPLPFETSAPGVFAVGDVRAGSLKRVAAAVGEGSSAVRSVHDYLAAHA